MILESTLLRVRPALVAALVGWLFAVTAGDAADVSQERVPLDRKFAAQLAALATWCDQQGLAAEGEWTRAWQIARDPLRLYLFLPATWTEPSTAEPASTRADWRERFALLRTEQADALYALARRAAEARQFSLAAELLLETLHESPDHAAARRMLGHVRWQGRWCTPFEEKQLQAGRTWDAQFGWLAAGQIERYQRGEAYYRGRWMSADEEAALRRDLTQGWRVETDHYQVTTNHSLAEGVRLARRLERLHTVWRFVFAPYYLSPAELGRAFASGSPLRSPGRTYQVACYRSREEYNDALRAAQPQIGITLGIYFDTVHRAYFFAGPQQSPGTVYHEATHQLLHESRSVARQVARENNFWIVEAIACYMESLTEHNGYCTLGGADVGRLPAARQRALVDDFYVPFARLVGYGMSDLQHDPQIAMLYSQAAGQAAFLIHGDGGRYRDPLMTYLDAVYSGRADAMTLGRVVGRSYQELDDAYHAFLRGVDAGHSPAAP